jgi:hypothetical protein
MKVMEVSLSSPPPQAAVASTQAHINVVIALIRRFLELLGLVTQETV